MRTLIEVEAISALRSIADIPYNKRPLMDVTTRGIDDTPHKITKVRIDYAKMLDDQTIFFLREHDGHLIDIVLTSDLNGAPRNYIFPVVSLTIRGRWKEKTK